MLPALVGLSKPQAAGRPDSLRPVIGAVVLLFVALLAVAGLKGYRDLTAARARERQLSTRVDETRRTIEQLRARIERLKSDPATLERLAREELGMVKARDVVIELPAALEEPPQAVRPAPPAPPGAKEARPAPPGARAPAPAPAGASAVVPAPAGARAAVPSPAGPRAVVPAPTGAKAAVSSPVPARSVPPTPPDGQ